MDLDTSLALDSSADFLSEPIRRSALPAILPLSHRRTLLGEAACRGIGIHSGKQVNLRLLPAQSGSGIMFRRSDIGGKEGKDNGKGDIAAIHSNIIDGRRCTLIANEFGVTVSTVEHICAALVGAGISDAIVELDGDEVPIMDGSSRDFLRMIHNAGVCDLPERRPLLRVLRDVTVYGCDTGVSASLEVSASLKVSDEAVYSYELDYDILGHQTYEFSFGTGDFAADIGNARTFGLVSELEILQSQGCALGASCANTLALGADGVVNEGGLRYADEAARHKVLDAIGDLSLCGYFILGRFSGHRSGHRLNSELLRALFADSENYEII